jgi:N-methylhydantoinase B
MSTAPDALRLEILKNALVAVTEEQAIALQQAAYSTNIKTRRDYSCAFLDAQARGIAQAFSQPSHLASMRYAIPKALELYGIERLRPGDGILTNVPHYGSVHLNDIALISPVFSGSRLMGYAVNIAHHMDVGGKGSGSLGMGADIFDEGLIIPPIRFVADGEIDENCLALLRANIRSPKEVVGDFRAQVAANYVATARLHELLAEYGEDELERLCGALLDYTERRTRACFSRIPDGVYSAEAFFDADPHNPEPIRLVVTITATHGEISVDLEGCSPQRPTSLNGSIGVSYAGVAYTLRCLIDRDIPVNHGFYNSFHFHAPEGTVVNCRFPAGVIGGADISLRLSDLTFKALAEAVPERAMASTKGTCLQVAFGAYDVVRRAHVSYYETIGGGEGALLARDGQDGIQCHIQNTENAPVEEFEQNYPVRVRRFSLIPNSDGAGRHRGGLGLCREYEFPDGEAEFSIVADGTHQPRWGLFGGSSGGRARYSVVIGDDIHEMPCRSTVKVPAGAIVRIESPGGGGWGSAHERELEAVLDDVLCERISEERARDIYGVVLNGATIDRESSSALRSERKG